MLALETPWPSIERTFWEITMGDLSGILPGLFYTGDGAEREDRGSGSIDGDVDVICRKLRTSRRWICIAALLIQQSD